jgi:hypothetical protein
MEPSDMKPSDMTALARAHPGDVLRHLFPTVNEANGKWMLTVHRGERFRFAPATGKWRQLEGGTAKGKGIVPLCMAANHTTQAKAKQRVHEALADLGLLLPASEQRKLDVEDHPLRGNFLTAPALWMAKAADCGVNAARIACCLFVLRGCEHKGQHLRKENADDLLVAASYGDFQAWGVTKAKANKAIKALIDAGLLTRTVRGTGHAKSIYRMVIKQWYESSKGEVEA